MQKRQLGQGDLRQSPLAYGCMRLVGDGSGADREKGKRAVLAAVDAGYTLFDHADIYAAGECELLFGQLLKENSGLREQILIASKCGIRRAGSPREENPARYDFSASHITSSVDASLQRLGTERLDLLLLHRPDYLMNVSEVAAAFDKLHDSGKVVQFGVSNFSVSQFELLQSAIVQPLQANQVEINLHNIDALSNGVLDQCQRLGVTVQVWCPIAGVAYPAWGNRFSDADDARIRAELTRQQQIYHVEDWVIALAWLLKLPAPVVPLIGSTSPSRIARARKALDVDYSREDWYRLLEARNGCPVP